MRLLVLSLAVALALFPPYFALYHGVDFSFSGFAMVPVMAVHFIAMLVHEMGHTVTRWLFGYPAFPTFDTELGVGMTRFAQRSYFFLGVIWAALAAGIFYLKKKKLNRQMLVLSGLALAHGFIAFSPAREILILYMGHGMEVVVSFACITAALRRMKKYHAGWRVAVMSATLYVALKNILMCIELIFTHMPRSFGTMKNGLYMSDFLRLQKITGWSLPATAAPLLVFALLFLAAAFLSARQLDRGVPNEGAP